MQYRTLVLAIALITACTNTDDGQQGGTHAKKVREANSAVADHADEGGEDLVEVDGPSGEDGPQEDSDSAGEETAPADEPAPQQEPARGDRPVVDVPEPEVASDQTSFEPEPTPAPEPTVPEAPLPRVGLLGGTISGLAPNETIVLRNNGGDELTISGSATTFTFATPIQVLGGYEVTLHAKPSTKQCSVQNGRGTLRGEGIIVSVAVSCVVDLAFELAPLFSAAVARWHEVGATDYTLQLNAAGMATREFTHVSSPLAIGGLVNGMTYTATLIATLPDAGVLQATARARPGEPLFDGPVHALSNLGTTTYLGGDFERVRVQTGSVTNVDSATGALVGATLPPVDGDVYAVTFAWGGTVIGGRFSKVAGQPRANLALIRADGTVDPSWNPGANGTVRLFTSCVTKGSLCVAGDFTSIGEQQRTGIAELDATGQLSAWDLKLDGGVRVVRGLTEPDGTSVLLIGGSFTKLGSSPCGRYAEIRWRSFGALPPKCRHADGAVNAMHLDSYRGYTSVSLAGEFENLDDLPAKYITMRIDVDGPIDSFKVIPPTRNEFARDGIIYIAGRFTKVNGVARAGVAALNTFYKVLAWDPMPEPAGSVEGLRLAGDQMFLYGSFTRIAGVERRGAAAVSANGLATPTHWNPNVNGAVHFLLQSSNDSILLAGGFTGAGGVRRERLAAFLGNGEIASWNPGADASVYALAVSGGTIFAGGTFETLDGLARARIGAVDASGAVTAWNPQADGAVSALAISGSTVYAGGSFATIGAAPRAYIAALDASGAATNWSLDANGAVRALVTAGTTLYAGGEFTQLGATPREHIGAVDLVTGAVTAWDPGADEAVDAIAIADGKVIAGGEFANIGGAVRARLAALDAMSGAATSWTADPDGAVRTLAVYDDALHVSGEFLTIGGLSRDHVAAYDATFTLLDTVPNRPFTWLSR